MRFQNQWDNIAVKEFADLPVRPDQRRRTDVFCVWLSSIFAIAMFALAIYYFDMNKLIRMTYPADSIGRTCGLDAKNHPYLYFTSVSDTSLRLCVNRCPRHRDVSLSCASIPGMSCASPDGLPAGIQIYQTQLEESRLGLYCLPTSPILRNMVLTNSGLLLRQNFLHSYDAIKLGMLTAVVGGVFFLLLVQCIPHIMVYASILLGGIGMIALAIIILFLDHTMTQPFLTIKYVSAALFILLGIVIIVSLFRHQRQIRIWGIFLRYSGKFIADVLRLMWVIPIFTVLLMALLALFIFQLLGYWSQPGQFLEHGSPFHHPQRTNFAVVMTVLNFIWLYWGFSFLNQASNFVNSGEAIEWYMRGNHGSARIDSIRNLFCYHWGSVVAGSFMLGFFTLPDTLFGIVRPRAPAGAYGSFFMCICGWISPLFELVRTQAMGYINMTGIPYCNACRYCQYICENSSLFNGNSKEINRVSDVLLQYYRLGSHAFLCSLATIVSILYMYFTNHGWISLYGWLFVLLSTMFLLTPFISLHQDAAIGLMIALLAQERVNGSINHVRAAPPGLIRQLLSI